MERSDSEPVADDARGDPSDDDAERGRSRSPRRWVRILLGAAVVLLLVGGVGAWWLKRSIEVPAKYHTVSYTVPQAPRLSAAQGQTVYRIDPTRSQLQYEIGEKIVGATASHAKGTTNGIAGDIALNSTAPQASKVGDIVVNVEQFHSDQDLRDARIRADFLESRAHPLALFTTTGMTGMPASVVPGQHYQFQLQGTATVKDTTAPAAWNVDAVTNADGELDATATTTIKLSTFGAGPISIAGLVSTSDDATLTMTIVALDPSKHAVPTSISAPKGVKPQGTSPSFRKTIQPILEANCASCHNTGQVGAEPWKLDTAGDAAKISTGIGTVTQAKYMPPWPASDLGVPLEHSKQLSPAELHELALWSKAGGQLDEKASTPIKPSANARVVKPRADETLTMPQAYEGSASVPNDYRCFVLDPKLTEAKYLTGYEFHGDQLREIHHAQVFHIRASQAAAVSSQAGQDGKPGWSCYAGPQGGQGGLIAGWVPGQDPVIYGHDAGVLFEPGDVLVLQIHYHHDDEAPTPDRSGISLQLDNPTRAINPIRIVNPLGPVEIPCMPGANAPLCDRSAALAADAQAYGLIGALAEPGLLALCHKTPEELTAGFNGIAHTSCQYRVPEDGIIIGAMGHMHTLGKSFRLTLDPGTPQQQIMLDIPTWNFDWQMNYSFVTPIHVTRGDTVQMDCTWDRSLDPNRPQKYIVFAEGTEDEMCFSTYALIPDRS